MPPFQQIHFQLKAIPNTKTTTRKRKKGREKDGSSTCMLITNFLNQRPISGCPCHPSSSLKSQKMRPIFGKKKKSIYKGYGEQRLY
jgi:hypothetical protein